MGVVVTKSYGIPQFYKARLPSYKLVCKPINKSLPHQVKRQPNQMSTGLSQISSKSPIETTCSLDKSPLCNQESGLFKPSSAQLRSAAKGDMWHLLEVIGNRPTVEVGHIMRYGKTMTTDFGIFYIGVQP